MAKKLMPGNRAWKYTPSGPGYVQCVGCKESDLVNTPADPFTRFDRIIHTDSCDYKDWPGGMKP